MHIVNCYKYVMIVTEETGEIGKNELTYFAERPWEGNLVDIVFGNTFDELIEDGRHEGLFFQLYAAKDGKRIAYGILDPDSPREEIEEYEKGNKV